MCNLIKTINYKSEKIIKKPVNFNSYRVYKHLYIAVIYFTW